MPRADTAHVKASAPPSAAKVLSAYSPQAPTGPARCSTPEEHKAFMAPPSQDEMERMAFEVSMVLRAPVKDDASLENSIQETLGLLHVIPALQAAAARAKGNVASILQSFGSGDQQEDATLALGLARLRQHLRIKMMDAEDLKCADKALQEAAAFFHALTAMAEREGICSYKLFLRLTA
jgi:hypothetical protein